MTSTSDAPGVGSSDAVGATSTTPGVCGLANLGNTCYMNAALQCLSHTTSFRQAFLETCNENSPSEDNQNKTGFSSAYQELLLRLWSGAETAIAPTDFREAVCSTLPQFKGTAQQDSPEFALALLNALQDELRLSKSAVGINLIQNTFNGSLTNSIHCPECGSDFKRQEEFMCLPLPLPETETIILYINTCEPAQMQYGIKVPWWTSVSDVLVQLSELIDSTVPRCLTAVSGQRVRRIFTSFQEVSDISSSDILWAFSVQPCLSLSSSPLMETQPIQDHRTSTSVVESGCSVGVMDVDDVVALGVPSVVEHNNSVVANNEDACVLSTSDRAEVAPSEIAAVAQKEEVACLDASADASSMHPRDDIIALPPLEVIALPPPSTLTNDEVIALPPSSGVIALPPPTNVLLENDGVNDEDIQQVACLCDVSTAVARKALLRTSGSLDRAVELIFDNPDIREETSLANSEEVKTRGVAQPQNQLPASIEQVVSVCGVTEAMAREALARSGNNLDQAVGLIFERPESFVVAVNAPEESNAIEIVCASSSSDGDNNVIQHGKGDDDGKSTDATRDISIIQHCDQEDAQIQTKPLHQQKLFDAVAIAHARRAAEALAEGANPCEADSNNVPPLHFITQSMVQGRVQGKHLAMLRLLLDARADTSMADARGCNLTHHLAEQSADTLLEELHTMGCMDLEARDKSGQTALHKSSAAGHASTVALLLRWGASREAKDCRDSTPAQIAEQNCREDVLDELLDRPRLIQLVHRVARSDIAISTSASAIGTTISCSSSSTSLALVAKEEGNAYLKVGNLPAAIEQYTLGIKLAKDDESTLLADCYNNRAAAHVQLRNYENVVSDTTECLALSSCNGKALVRRAQAYQQLEKLKAAYIDISAALRCELSTNFAKIARNVHKEIKGMLLADGVDIDALDPDGPPPIVGTGVMNIFQSRYNFPLPPFVLAIPRQCRPSGKELYDMSWKHATQEISLPLQLPFDLRLVDWDAENEGIMIACDGFGVDLPCRGTLAMDWRESPKVVEKLSSPIQVHNSASELKKEETRSVTLSSCLDALVQERTLGSSDAWHCPKCNEPRQVSIRSIVDKLPKVLILQLKRFRFSGRRRDKILSLVDFPTRDLDFSPWSSQLNQTMFELFGVVNHIGSFGGGHYTANARPSSYTEGRDVESWYHFNDALCRPARDAELVTRDAYLLFYAQRSPS